MGGQWKDRWKEGVVLEAVGRVAAEMLMVVLVMSVKLVPGRKHVSVAGGGCACFP